MDALHAEPEGNGELAQHRVLILEDNPFQREALAATLAGIGVGYVQMAGCGREALALLNREEQGFNATLCDLQMANGDAMDGIEFIRSAPARKVGALIVTSGLNEDLMKCAEMLAHGYGFLLTSRLRKPIDVNRLRAILRTYPAVTLEERWPPPIAPMPIWTKADIVTALRQHQFIPYFQPKISLTTGELTGVEALARWIHPDLGVLPPSQFIPIMERDNLIDDMTEHIFEQSLVAAKQWSTLGMPLNVALNASSLTLQNVKVPNRWRAIADEHRVDTGMLTVELTETTMADEANGLLETLTRLRMHGFGVSLDDFGTGYASLQQLCNMPISELKIDRSFVAWSSQRKRSVLILDAIIHLAKKLHLKTVGEGIETAADAVFLKVSGCDTGQGYHFARPMPATALTAWSQALRVERQQINQRTEKYPLKGDPPAKDAWSDR